MSLQPEALGTLFEMSGDAILGINNDNIIAFANPAAASLLGAAAGKSAIGIVPRFVLDDPGKQLIVSVTVAGRHGHIAVSRLEGLSLLCYTFPAAEKLPALLNQAMYDMANSLMSFRLALDRILNSHSPKDDFFHAYAATLYKEYYRIKRLQQHLAMVGAIQQDSLPFEPKVEDLAQLCGTVCDSVNYFFKNSSFAFSFQAPPGDYLTYLDPGLIKSMLLNLLSNSLAHIKDGGMINVTLTRQGKRFILSVDDTGSGIAPDALPAAFNGITPADTIFPDKLGTGLLIARGVAERHGGALILESRPGQGTSVRVSLPFREPDIPTLHSPPYIRRNSGESELVLTELSTVLDKKFYADNMLD